MGEADEEQGKLARDAYEDGQTVVVRAASSLLANTLASAAMATLHLRNVPAEIDAALAAAASVRGVSKNQRAIEALRRGLGLDQVERAQLIDEIRHGRRPVDLDVAELIREDRPAERP